MNFDDWEPAYEAILADFGYARVADEAARDDIRRRVEPFDPDRFSWLAGATVAIAGAGPNLEDEVAVAADADHVIAASTAADVLRDAGVDVDCLTTDLDKTPETAVALSEAGVPVVVHAHGDNRDALAEWVPRFASEQVLATTQAAPTPPVQNFGGFTDGDRAAFLADHFGASRLVFPGWAFDDATVGEEKRRKLRWAERLLAWLERRRGERFAILDGRRAALDRSFLDG
jgi:uncharacterized Rossmann fold enzyme